MSRFLDACSGKFGQSKPGAPGPAAGIQEKIGQSGTTWTKISFGQHSKLVQITKFWIGHPVLLVLFSYPL